MVRKDLICMTVAKRFLDFIEAPEYVVENKVFSLRPRDGEYAADTGM